MPIPRRTALALGAALPLRAAHAQEWPSRPVRVVVPWAPGGAIDTIARALAARLGPALGQPFLVENRTGGGGVIGMAEAARAAPDGHTLLALDNSYTMLPHTAASLPWDHAHGFLPVVLGGSAPFLLVVSPALGLRTLAELTAAARQAPERLSYGTGGAGSSPHFATEAFMQRAGIRLLHVPYRGGAEAMLAVVAGQVNCSMATVSAAGGQLAAGRLLPLALAAPARSPLVPSVPTFTEAGMAGFSAGIWAGLAAPAGTPAPVLARLEAACQAALREDALKRDFAAQGLQVEGMGQQGFAALVRAETARWGEVAKAAGILRG